MSSVARGDRSIDRYSSAGSMLNVEMVLLQTLLTWETCCDIRQELFDIAFGRSLKSIVRIFI